MIRLLYLMMRFSHFRLFISLEKLTTKGANWRAFVNEAETASRAEITPQCASHSAQLPGSTSNSIRKHKKLPGINAKE